MCGYKTGEEIEEGELCEKDLFHVSFRYRDINNTVTSIRSLRSVF